MERFLKNVPGTLRTAIAFLLILACMVTASVASVRAEEQTDGTPFYGIEEAEKETEKSEETGKVKETDQIGGNEIEKKGEGETESSGMESGENMSAGENLSAEEETEDLSRGESQEEDTDSGKIPIGRKDISGDCGTAYVVGTSGIMLRSAVGSDCTITPGTEHYYGSWSTNEFHVATENGAYMGYCAQPSKPTPSGIYKVAELNNDKIKLALMFGADGPWAAEAPNLFGGAPNPYPYLHAMIGIEYTGETNGLTSQQVNDVVGALNDLVASGRAQLPIFQEYKVFVAYNNAQDIVWLEHVSAPTPVEPPVVVKGKAWLQKSSANPSITDGNSCYSLKDAEYGIYSDASCTAKVDTFTTSASGKSETVELEPGDYWVKEIRAPKGYKKDTKAHAVHVSEGATSKVSVSDVPKSTRSVPELVKRDLETKADLPQGSATLAGARFTVKYYAGYYTRTSLPARPAKTWVLETKERNQAGGTVEYMASLGDGSLVSGDDFYTLNGSVILPLGTITVEETREPVGYRMEGAYLQTGESTDQKKGLYIAQVKENGNAALLEEGNQYKIYDQVIRGGVKIRKRDFDTKKAEPQGAAALEGAEIQIINQNANPVTVDGKTCPAGAVITTLTLDSNGNAQTAADFLPYGTYKLVEKTAPKGYLNEGIIEQEFSVRENGVIVDLTEPDQSIQNRVIRGGVKIQKRDLETRKAQPQGGAELEGAAVQIISLNENPVVVEGKVCPNNAVAVTLTLDAKGTAQTSADCLPYGTYKAVESTAPKGYLNEGVIEQKFTISQQGVVLELTDADQSIQNQVIRGGVKIQKRDYDTKACIPQGAATLEGATVQIVNQNANPVVVGGQTYPCGAVAATLTLDAAGAAQTAADFLPYGKYKLVEQTAPEGYLNTGIIEQEFSVQENGVVVDMSGADQSIQNQVIRGGVKIQKRDFETKDTIPQGGASLENAVFTITTLNENPVIVNGRSYQKNEVAVTMKTNAEGLMQTTSLFLPYGKYRITETGAPTGYLGSGVMSQEFAIRKNGEIVDLTDVEHSIQNQIKRGDFELRKIDSETQDIMPGVSFRLTSTTTGESHVFTTDENGYYSSASEWNRHTYQTNQGGKEDGLWFGTDGKGKSAPIDEEKGALPYDTYTIEEIPSDANKGKIMFKGTLVIYKNKVTVPLANIENKGPDEKTPAISTTARNEATGNHFAQPGPVSIMDSVMYTGLEAKQEYILRCIPMLKSAKKPLTDQEGNTITAEETFTAAASAGIAEVECTFDASALGGEDIVIYEELYREGEKIAEHKDIEDEGQTIHFPEIKTRAQNPETGSNVVEAETEIKIVDTVSYKNLKVGQEYTLIGKLMDKETAAVIKDASGEEVTAKTKFVPEKKDGEVQVTFVFDGSNLHGKTLVAFETLKKNEKVYAVHADIEDQDQTIYIPEVSTQAWDVKSGTRNAKAEEHVAIVDAVSYKNLVPGKEYTVIGTLMDKDTEKPLLVNGKEVTAETTFIPEEPEGTIDVEFELDGSKLEGKTTVAFESMVEEGREVASHTDLHFDGQTIYFPKIGTRAGEKGTGKQVITAEKEITIVDTVAFENLIPETEYTVKGILMDRSANKALLADGKEITSETSFVPKEKNGTVEVEFCFDAGSLQNQDVVVFEKLYAGEAEIAAHEDLQDQGQTVKINPSVPPVAAEIAKSVKTGDAANILPWFVPLAGAIFGMAAATCYRKKKTRNRR